MRIQTCIFFISLFLVSMLQSCKLTKFESLDNKYGDEYGNYSIEGDQITLTAGKYNFKGTIVEDKIIIDDKEYIKQSIVK